MVMVMVGCGGGGDGVGRDESGVCNQGAPYI